IATMLSISGLAAANAQTAAQQPTTSQIGQPLPQAGVAPTTTNNSSSLTMPTQSGFAGAPTGTASSLDATSSAIAATSSDPLAVPTSTLPPASQTTTGQTTTGSVVTGAISASPTVDPQHAVQLPGEGANSSRQAPTTSASAASGGAGASTSSNAACSTAIPTTTGASGVGGLFGAGSVGGC
ncbi:MAG TPA: hypothetical protein VGD75_02160, partial [Bradyrhizobium sp.]